MRKKDIRDAFMKAIASEGNHRLDSTQRLDTNSSKIKSLLLQTNNCKILELCSAKDTRRISEAVVRRCSWKKVSLKISEKFRPKHMCISHFFKKLQV